MRLVAAGLGTCALAMAAAVALDVALFGNYGAVPLHSAWGLLALVGAVVCWLGGRREG